MARSYFGTGRYVAAENDMTVVGRNLPPGRTAILYGQGSHALAANQWITADDDGRSRNGLLAEYWPVFSGDLSQTLTQGTFGNDTAQTRLGQLKTWAQGSGSPISVAAGAVFGLGGSGGCAALLNHARANPTFYKALYLMMPLTDLNDVYVNRVDATITQSEINKAYNNGVDDGGTAYQAARPTHSPIEVGVNSGLAGIPIRLAYSTNDPYIPVSVVTAYQSAVQAAGGSCSVVSVGAQGHSAPVAALPTQDIIDFFKAHE